MTELMLKVKCHVFIATITLNFCRQRSREYNQLAIQRIQSLPRMKTTRTLENWHSEECKLMPTLTFDLLTSNKISDLSILVICPLFV